MNKELKDLSGEDISMLLGKYFEEIRTVRELADVNDNDVLDKKEYDSLIRAKTEQAIYFKKTLLKLESDDFAKSMLDGYLRSCEIEPDHDHQKYAILKRGFILQYKKYFDDLVKRYSGESTSQEEENIYNKYLLQLDDNASENAMAHINSSRKGRNQKKVYRLSEVWAKYKEDKVKNDNKRANTLAEYEKFFQLFVDITGDVDISMVDKSDIRKFREVLLKWPKNKNKIKRFRDKTIDEIINMDIPEEDSITEKTRRNYICALMSYWSYAEKMGYAEDNPIKGFGVKISAIKVNKKIRPFDSIELNKIFSSSAYDDTNEYAYRYWLPVIGLFSGMRVNEICQLYLTDIKEVEGVWVFDVNDDLDKQIKNEASRRLVPVHPFLINQLDILGYVDKLTRLRSVRLFPELKVLEKTGKYNHVASQWFGRLKTKLGFRDEIINSRNISKIVVNFHSFRKNFGDYCKQNKVELSLDEHMYKRIMGHTLNDITADVYANDFSPRVLYDNIMIKMNFEEMVDFSHVMRTRPNVK
ncbi:MAG: hypothetical protein ACP59X_10335 [Solidesulfovibrio sp. DCME]|uniref:hypothetical protein n=1 Tax=Solidesulfovibrio sp. DCME TaxID=3447380 RepID=UPI003D1204E1